MKRWLWIGGLVGTALLLSNLTESALFMIVAVVLAPIIHGWFDKLEKQEKQERSRARRPRASAANDLTSFQLNHLAIDSPHLLNRCGSCEYWTGPKTTHKSKRGVFIHKEAKGDCAFRRPGSPRLGLKATAGQACADYE